MLVHTWNPMILPQTCLINAKKVTQINDFFLKAYHTWYYKDQKTTTKKKKWYTVLALIVIKVHFTGYSNHRKRRRPDKQRKQAECMELRQADP